MGLRSILNGSFASTFLLRLRRDASGIVRAADIDIQLWHLKKAQAQRRRGGHDLEDRDPVAVLAEGPSESL
jgi:hypothetical protein